MKTKKPLIAMFFIYIVILNPEVSAKKASFSRILDDKSDKDKDKEKWEKRAHNFWGADLAVTTILYLGGLFLYFKCRCVKRDRVPLDQQQTTYEKQVEGIKEEIGSLGRDTTGFGPPANNRNKIVDSA